MLFLMALVLYLLPSTLLSQLQPPNAPGGGTCMGGTRTISCSEWFATRHTCPLLVIMTLNQWGGVERSEPLVMDAASQLDVVRSMIHGSAPQVVANTDAKRTTIAGATRTVSVEYVERVG